MSTKKGGSYKKILKLLKLNCNNCDFELILNSIKCNSLRMEAFERLGFLASFGPHGTGRTEGGEKTQPFKLIPSRLFT